MAEPALPASRRAYCAWLALGLGLPLVACSEDDLKANGKNHVLFFQPGADAMLPIAQGLSGGVNLPRQAMLIRGCGKFDAICQKKTFDYDLDDTEIVAEVDAGLRVVDATLGPAGYKVRVACDEPPASSVGELRVKISKAGTVRYEDAFDLGCRRPFKLDFSFAPAQVAIGAQVTAEAQAWARDTTRGQTAINGAGWVFQDPSGELMLATAPPPEGLMSEFVLDALAPGAGATVTAGPLSVPLPTEVLPDDGWSLKLAASACSFENGALAAERVTVSAENASGAPVVIQSEGCEFTFTTLDGTLLTASNQRCDVCISGAPGGGKACASLRGKTVCVDVDATGEGH